MTPLPKRKHSKARRDNRRAHDFLTPIVSNRCKNCGDNHLPHHVCKNCGFYGGKKVLEVKAKE